MEGFKALASQQGCSADGTTAMSKNPVSNLISKFGTQGYSGPQQQPSQMNQAMNAALGGRQKGPEMHQSRHVDFQMNTPMVNQRMVNQGMQNVGRNAEAQDNWMEQFENFGISNQRDQNFSQPIQQRPVQHQFVPQHQRPMNYMQPPMMMQQPRMQFPAQAQPNYAQSYMPQKQPEVYREEIQAAKEENKVEAKPDPDAIRQATRDLVNLMSKDDQFKDSTFYKDMVDVAEGKNVITNNEIVENVDSPGIQEDMARSMPKVFDALGELSGNNAEFASARATFEQAYQAQMNGTNVDFDKVFNEAFPASHMNTVDTSKAEYRMEENNPFTQENEASQDLDALFQKGLDLFDAGELRDAVYAFEAVIHADPSHSEAWRMLGSTHQERDEDAKAILALESSIENDPYNLHSLLSLGVSYVNELNQTKALNTLKTWVERNPKFSGVQVDDIYGDGSGTDLMHDVMMLMTKVEEVAPQDPGVQEVLGVLYNVSRDYEQAANAFRKAINADPNEYTLWNKLGATLANHSKSKDALPMYTRALELKPRYARAWLNFGISHSNLGEYRKAIQAYLRALQLNPEAVHIWNYLRICVSCLPDCDHLLAEVDKHNLAAFDSFS